MNENRVSELTELLNELAETAGGRERTRIAPNLTVIDASPAALPATYIIIEDDEGFYIPALKVPGITYTAGDKVNVIFIKGTEPVAFQQGSDSVSSPTAAIAVRKNSGANVGTQPRLNFIEGANTTYTITDDGVDSEVDITVNAALTVRKNSGADVGTRPRLNLVEGANITLTVADDAGGAEIDVTIAATEGGWPTAGKAMINNTEYASIAAAIAAASAGDIIKIGQGTFTEQFSVGVNVTLVGLSAADTIITNSHASNPTVIVTTAGVVLKNMTIISTGAAACALRFDAAGRAENVVTSTTGGTLVSYGLFANTTGKVELVDCEITNTSGATSRYGVVAAASANIEISRGIINATTGDTQGASGATISYFDPRLIGGGVTGAGTHRGWYFNSTGGHVGAGTTDTFPQGNSAGLFKRSVNFGYTPRCHFASDYGILTNWAGAPFVTPSSPSFGNDCLTIYHNVNTQRCFRYETVSVSPLQTITLTCRLALGPYVTVAGLRADDGSDTNYVEFGLNTETSTLGLVHMSGRATGGSGWVTALSNILGGMFYGLQLIVQGSAGYLLGYYKVDSMGDWQYVANIGSGRSWTATRVGIIYTVSNTGGDNSRSASFDWYN